MLVSPNSINGATVGPRCPIVEPSAGSWYYGGGTPSIGSEMMVSQNSSVNCALVNQRIMYVAFQLDATVQVKSATVQVVAAYSGGTASLGIALYDVDKTSGLPGNLLYTFGTAGSLSSATSTVTLTASGNPMVMEPGWYYIGILSKFSGGSGTPSIRACLNRSLGPAGMAFAASIPFSFLRIAGATSFSDPAATGSIAGEAATQPPFVTLGLV